MTRWLAAALLACAGASCAADSIFLVAKKDMPDPNFHDTVVLVTRVEGEPIGVILNRPTRITLAAVFGDVERNVRPDDRLHFGGPVMRQAVTFLVKARARPEDAFEVIDGVYFSSSRKLLYGILSGDTPVEALRVFAGYAGWAPGQLEAEVSRGDWHGVKPDAASIFDKDPARLWPEMDRRASRTQVRLDRAHVSGFVFVPIAAN